MDRRPPHVLRAVTLPPPPVNSLYIPFQSTSHSVYTNVSNDNHVLIFSSDKRLGSVDIVQRWLHGNRLVGREWEACRPMTSFRGISIRYEGKFVNEDWS
jgi:hypothetical protein